MIIKEISSFVAVDEIVVEDSGKYLHFVTHLDHCLNVPDNWGSIIYTSRHVAKVLTLKKCPIAKKYFRIIEPNEQLILMLRDGKMLKVRMFTNDGFNGNVMFYFQCGNESQTTALYTGPFIRYRSILLNDHFRNCVLAGIDHLYVDNTRAHSTDNETIQSVGCKIQNILQKYPEHIIMLNIPPFGYEDLIFSLVKDFGLKIFGGKLQVLVFELSKLENIYVTNAMDAKIIIGEEAVTLEKIKYRFSRKRITMRFCESNFALKYNDFEKIGYFQIHWTPHPSLVQLYAFIDFVKPKNVSGIYDDMPNLPIFLTSLCKKQSVENCGVVGVETDNLNIAENQPSIEKAPAELNSGQVSNVNNTRNHRADNTIIDASENYLHSTYLRRQTELPRNLAKVKSKNSLLRNIAIIRPNIAIACLPIPQKVDKSNSLNCISKNSSALIMSRNEPNNVIPILSTVIENIEEENEENILSGSELSSNISIPSEDMHLAQNEASNATTSQSHTYSPVIVFDDNSEQSPGQTHLFEKNNGPSVSRIHRSVEFSNNASALSSQIIKNKNLNKKRCNKRSAKVKSFTAERSFSRINKSQRSSLGVSAREPREILSDDSATPNSRRSNARTPRKQLHKNPKISCQIHTTKKTNLFSKKPTQIVYSSDED